MSMNVLIGLMIPFVGTTLGSAMVFFMKDKLNDRLEKVLLGFAAGIMIAASFFSLLKPAEEIAGTGGVLRRHLHPNGRLSRLGV